MIAVGRQHERRRAKHDLRIDTQIQNTVHVGIEIGTRGPRVGRCLAIGQECCGRERDCFRHVTVVGQRMCIGHRATRNGALRADRGQCHAVQRLHSNLIALRIGHGRISLIGDGERQHIVACRCRGRAGRATGGVNRRNHDFGANQLVAAGRNRYRTGRGHCSSHGGGTGAPATVSFEYHGPTCWNGEDADRHRDKAAGQVIDRGRRTSIVDEQYETGRRRRRRCGDDAIGRHDDRTRGTQTVTGIVCWARCGTAGNRKTVGQIDSIGNDSPQFVGNRVADQIVEE